LEKTILFVEPPYYRSIPRKGAEDLVKSVSGGLTPREDSFPKKNKTCGGPKHTGGSQRRKRDIFDFGLVNHLEAHFQDYMESKRGTCNKKHRQVQYGWWKTTKERR